MKKLVTCSHLSHSFPIKKIPQKTNAGNFIRKKVTKSMIIEKAIIELNNSKLIIDRMKNAGNHFAN